MMPDIIDQSRADGEGENLPEALAEDTLALTA